MSDNRPIGIFDSGLGGLTVAKQIIGKLPCENIIYLGDNARVPYGGRSKETIIKFSFEIADFLISKNVKCIVIACNTASAFAGRELESKLSIPVFDVITPALKAAKKISSGGKIGVIGTRGTIGSGAYNVPFSKACPLLVPFIEEGEVENPALKIVARNYLDDLKGNKIDTLILGCTHYPIIKDMLKNGIGEDVEIIDPGISMAETLKTYLTEKNLLTDKKTTGSRKYFVTDYTERFSKVAEMFLDHKINHDLQKIDITK